MKRRHFVVLFAVLTLLHVPINAQERYVCVPIQAAGFSFDQSLGRWKSVNLRAVHEQYIISGQTTSDRALTIVSSEAGVEECRSDKGFGNNNEAHFTCFFGEFKFNKNTGRFIRTFTAGYVDGLDNLENTPAIVIGNCSAH